MMEGNGHQTWCGVQYASPVCTCGAQPIVAGDGHDVKWETDVVPMDSKTLNRVRTFATGATRGNEEGKLEYSKFISPLVTKRYAEFMHKNRHQLDGTLRSGSNWQRGIEKDSYVASLDRHVIDVKLHHDGYSDEAVEDLETALCATIFNASGLLFEILKEKRLAKSVSKVLGSDK